MPEVDNEGARIHYQVAGSGPPLMLIAGTGYSGSTWHPRLCTALSERYTLITFDHRGTGRSTATPQDYTTALFGRDALAVLRAVGAGPAHVLGHSMGGRVAQELYFAGPGAVRSLVMAASGAGTEEPRPIGREGVPHKAVSAMVRVGFDQYIRDKHRANFFTAEFAQRRPEEVDWLDRAYLDSAPTLDEYLKHIRARQAHGAGARLHAVDVPVLVLVGTADTNPGGTGSHLDGAHELCRLMPRARLELIPGAKHGYLWGDVDLSVRILDEFLAAVADLTGVAAPAKARAR